MSATPIHVPRLNANDDSVNVVQITVALGEKVTAGAIVAEVETDKTIIQVSSPHDGFILRVAAEIGQVVPVGGIIAWVGATGNESIEEIAAEDAGPSDDATLPTLGARGLLARYGLEAAEVPSQGTRLTVADVQRHINALGMAPAAKQSAPDTGHPLPAVGSRKPMSPFQRGMANTVQWHRAVPVAAYIEVPFDHAAWRSYADHHARSSGALIDPLLSLIAYRLVRAALVVPEINATLVDQDIHYYEAVNLGFSVKTASGLAMVVAREAHALDEAAFVKALGRLQRSALAGRLTQEQVSGTTLAFSSLAGAGVSRHVPVLPPATSIIVAHSSADASGRGTLGASYDHRLLDGDAVARVLNSIKPPDM